MTKLYIDMTDAQGFSIAPFNDNVVSSSSLGVGTIIADLLDDTQTATGVSLAVTSAFNSSTTFLQAANTGVGDFNQRSLGSVWYTSNGGTGSLKFANLPASGSYTIQLIGHTLTSVRDTEYTVDGTSKDYINSADANAPTVATQFTGTVPTNGELVIDVTAAVTGQFYGQLNGIVLEYTSAPAPSLTIDSTDSTMQRGTNFEVVCSGATTAPTTANTTLTNGNDTLTPSSVTGSDPYTLTFAVGDLTKQVDATGYDWTLTVDVETATTGNIPLVIQADYTKVDLVSPVTTNASLLFGYTGDAPVTGDDLEYSVTSVLNSGVTFSVAADGVWTITEASEGDWTTAITVDRRIVQANGTIGTEATMTFDPRVGAPAAAGSIPYAMRQMAMRLSFHSYLIQESKGRWEQDQLNAAIVALGGSAMTPPVGAPDAAVGYTGTQTYLEFYKRLQRALVYPTPIDVVPAVQAALLARGWTL